MGEVVRRGGIMGGEARFNLRDAHQRPVPSGLQLARDVPVLRVGDIILTECPVGGVPRRLEVAHQGLAHLVPPRGGLRLGRQRRLDSGGADHGE
jgi:hypothetical protein